MLLSEVFDTYDEALAGRETCLRHDPGCRPIIYGPDQRGRFILTSVEEVEPQGTGRIDHLSDEALYVAYQTHVGGREVGSLSPLGEKILAEVDRRASGAKRGH